LKNRIPEREYNRKNSIQECFKLNLNFVGQTKMAPLMIWNYFNALLNLFDWDLG